MKKKWTVLLIPGASGEVHDITFSIRILTLVMIAMTAALLASAMFCARSIRIWKESSAGTISQLQSDISKRDKELGSIRTEFSKLLELEDKLRTMAGLKPRETVGVSVPGKGGQGGPEPEEELLTETSEFHAVESSFDVSAIPADGLILALVAAQDSFSEIMGAFEREQRRLASIPSINPVLSRDAWISSGFNYRADPLDGRTRFHEGVDLVAPRQTRIIAPGDGIVTFAGWREGLGQTLEISHGYGYRTIYGHNEKLLRRTGDYVERGDIIALLGSSGRSTGPHLHYEIRLGGRLVNPCRYLID